jgi:hypothetical protein
MGMQNHSRFKPGGVIFAPNFQFFFRIGVFLAGKDADKRRKLDSVCFDPVINTMVLSIYLENYELSFVHSRLLRQQRAEILAACDRSDYTASHRSLINIPGRNPVSF